MFSSHKSTTSGSASEQKTEAQAEAPAEDIVSMFRLYLENILLCLKLYDRPQPVLE